MKICKITKYKNWQAKYNKDRKITPKNWKTIYKNWQTKTLVFLVR